jgi:hypothetical protein
LRKFAPSAQRNFRKAVRGLIKYALHKSLIEIDPFATVKLAKMKQKGEFRGYILWQSEECEQLEAAHVLKGTGTLIVA